jgi:trimeric autotransporter adhesin
MPRYLLIPAFVLALLLASPAWADETIGGACSGTVGYGPQSNGNNVACVSSLWQYPAYQFGNTSGSCNSTNAGMVRYNPTSLQYCNSSTWTTLATGSPALSGLLAATTTNLIDSSNWAQTWAWGTLSTQTALTFTTSSMTGGTLLSLQDTAAAATSTGYVLSVTDASTGAGYSVYSAMTGHGNTGFAGYFTNTDTGADANYGVYGTDASASGYGGYFTNTSTGWALNATGTSYFNGSVGIGTATPAYPLSISLSSGIAGIEIISNQISEGGLYVTNGNATFGEFGINNNNLQISSGQSGTTAGAITMTWDTGYVGIGTTSPQASLHIASGGFLSGASATSMGAVKQNYTGVDATSWFGLYNSNTSLYYGISAALPSPAGTSTLGGYYKGLGIGGSTNNTGNPIFGVLTSTQTLNGIGATAFTIYDTNKVVTIHNVLDDGSGNVGIGTTSPGANLDLVSTSTGAAYALRSTISGNANTGYAGYFSNTATTANYGVYATSATTTSGYGLYSAVTGAANTGYSGYFTNTATSGANYALYASNAAASGYGGYFTNSNSSGVALWCSSSYPNGCGGNESWYNTSDLRAKDAVTDLPSARGLDGVLKLRPVTYRWKDKTREQSEHLGLIAQEVEAVYPEVVGMGRDGIRSMAYSDLVVPLIKAVQELKTDNDNLRGEVEKQDAELAELRKEVAAVKVRAGKN